MVKLPGQEMKTFPLVKVDGEGIGTVTLRADLEDQIATSRMRLVLSYELVEQWVGAKKEYHIRSFAIVPEPSVPSEEKAISGVWITYVYDDSAPIGIYVFETELEALRKAVDAQHHVIFVPHGTTIREAIEHDGESDGES